MCRERFYRGLAVIAFVLDDVSVGKFVVVRLVLFFSFSNTAGFVVAESWRRYLAWKLNRAYIRRWSLRIRVTGSLEITLNSSLELLGLRDFSFAVDLRAYACRISIRSY